MSSAPPVPADYRPALRSEVLLSDEMLHGDRTVHLIKDIGSGQSFEVGVKEHFLIARMDGSRSLAELGAAYAHTYGRRLGDANWRQLLGLLGGRGLLADGQRSGSGGPQRSGGPHGGSGGTGGGSGGPHGSGATGGPGGPNGSGATGGSAGPAASVDRPADRPAPGSVRLVADADATARRLDRAVGFLLAPAWTVPLMVSVLAMLVALTVRIGDLFDGAVGLLGRPVLLVAAATALWLSTALHELAHGVVAAHHGGRVTEIGLRWRPIPIMYCTVDNYLYLPRRSHRMATAVAGAVMNLLFLLPFAALWLLTPVTGGAEDALAGLLLLGGAQALLMLAPLPPLDGYKLFSQAVGATALAASSVTYLRLALRRDPAAARYPRRARRAYTAYGAGAVLTVCVLVAVCVLIVVQAATR